MKTPSDLKTPQKKIQQARNKGQQARKGHNRPDKGTTGQKVGHNMPQNESRVSDNVRDTLGPNTTPQEKGTTGQKQGTTVKKRAQQARQRHNRPESRAQQAPK